MYFVVNKMSYFSVSGPGPLLTLLSPILIMPIQRPNVSRMCSRYKTSSELCSFSATDCPFFNVD